MSVQFARDIIAAAQAAGGSVEAWIVPGAEHTQAMVVRPEEYEGHLEGFFGRTLGVR